MGDSERGASERGRDPEALLRRRYALARELAEVEQLYRDVARRDVTVEDKLARAERERRVAERIAREHGW